MELRRLERVTLLLEELRRLSLEMPVIVEGRRDERSLREAGLRGEILRVHSNTSLLEFCDGIAAKYEEVVLFTDLDSAGRRIGRAVKKYLTDKGVKVNDSIARKLMHALDTAEAENVSKRLEKTWKRYRCP